MFEVKVQLFRLHSEHGHVGLMASRVAAYKIRYYLLVESMLFVNAVEYGLKLLEQAKSWLPHQFQHFVACMLRGYLQPPAYMMAYQFLRVLPRITAAFFVAVVVEQKVVAHAAANETFFYSGQRIHGMVYVKKFPVVCVEVRAYSRVYATWPLAFFAQCQIFARHTIHIGRRPSEV